MIIMCFFNIDCISYYHLSRKLNSNNGYYLVSVLCNNTSLFKFLIKYGLTFKFDELNDYSRVFL